MPRALPTVRLCMALLIVGSGASAVLAADGSDRAPAPPRGEHLASRAGGYVPIDETQPLTGQSAPLPDEPRRLPAQHVAAVPQAARPTSEDHQLRLAPATPEAPNAFRFKGANLPPVVTALGSLGIVLGIFLLVVFVVKRGMPKPQSLLPPEAVEVLGRVPLMGRHQGFLIRLGNKMVLVCVTPSGVEPLAEVDDPAEVDRLAGLCRSTHSESVSTSFQQILHQQGGRRRFQPAEPEFDEIDLNSRYARELNA